MTNKTHLDKIADIATKLPMPVINDVNQRVADWLSTGGHENDGYIEQQLRYAEMHLRKTKIISGFPGIGKTFLSKDDALTLDSDSSQFSWIKEGQRHPHFPDNYIYHIERNIGKVDTILVSSHLVVRNALRQQLMDYTVVYPSITLKEEYLTRYMLRGSDKSFIDLMEAKWDDFINEIEAERFPNLVKLEKGQYLKDVLDKI